MEVDSRSGSSREKEPFVWGRADAMQEDRREFFLDTEWNDAPKQDVSYGAEALLSESSSSPYQVKKVKRRKKPFLSERSSKSDLQSAAGMENNFLREVSGDRGGTQGHGMPNKLRTAADGQGEVRPQTFQTTAADGQDQALQGPQRPWKGTLKAIASPRQGSEASLPEASFSWQRMSADDEELISSRRQSAEEELLPSVFASASSRPQQLIVDSSNRPQTLQSTAGGSQGKASPPLKTMAVDSQVEAILPSQALQTIGLHCHSQTQLLLQTQVEPMLQGILDMVQQLESKQQVQLEGLLSKVVGIEDKILKAPPTQGTWQVQLEGLLSKVSGIEAHIKTTPAIPAPLPVHDVHGPGSELRLLHKKQTEIHHDEHVRNKTAEGSVRCTAHRKTLAGSPGDAGVLEHLLAEQLGETWENALNQSDPQHICPSTGQRRSVKTSETCYITVKISFRPAGETEWKVPSSMAEERLVGSSVHDEEGNSRSSTVASAGELQVEVIGADKLHNTDSFGKSDPYCNCEIGHQGKPRGMFRTNTINNSLNPCWDHKHTFEDCAEGDSLRFVIKDRDMGRSRDTDEILGSVKLNSDQFFPDGFYGTVQLYTWADGSDEEEEEDDELRRQVSKLSGLKHNLQASEEREFSVSGSSKLYSLANMSTTQQDTSLDIVMVVIILLNAIVIGISMDYEYGFFAVVDIAFTITYILEVALKWRIHGVLGYFKSFYHCLDFLIISFDVMQLILSRFVESSIADETPSAAMFRVARLARLVRVARLVRLDVFDDLIAMITGIIGGMSTLTWAIILFILIVYVTSLLFREFFGRTPQIMTCEECGDVDITEYFSSVPRSMLTVFRYFFGDFNTIQGVNLLEGVLISYGALAAHFVGVLFFVITVGVFNVIAAIFVERTMSAAYAVTKSRKTDRLNDNVLWSTRISCLIRHFIQAHGMVLESSLSESLHQIAAIPLTEHDFVNSFIKDAEVIKAMDDLEIDAADHKYLFDILDNDNTGSIFISQLVDGVRRLRGDPRRSDIITVDLMVRAIQEQTNMLVEGMESALGRLTWLVEAQTAKASRGSSSKDVTRTISSGSNCGKVGKDGKEKISMKAAGTSVMSALQMGSKSSAASTATSK